MADTKPSAFVVRSTPSDGDWNPYIFKDGVSAGNHAPRIMTMSDLLQYISNRQQVETAITAAVSVGATDTMVISQALPQNRIKAGTKFEFEMSVTKTAAGTGTPVVTVRHGTTNSITDAARLTFTWPAANTAVADEMKLSVMGTFRSVGSGTTAVIEGMMIAEHELTTTGFGGTALGSNIVVNATSSGFDSTTASTFLSVTINGSTGAAWTVRQAWVRIGNFNLT